MELVRLQLGQVGKEKKKPFLVLGHGPFKPPIQRLDEVSARVNEGEHGHHRLDTVNEMRT